MNPGSKVLGNTINDGSNGGVYNNGTFTMNGGEIRGNSARYGGGVGNNGTFTMNGGTISGNAAAFQNGGGVENNGTFTMTGGTISGNTATYHGGGVNNGGNGTFTMTGGTISDNTVTYNHYNYGGGGVSITGSEAFTMTGGTIGGNRAPTGSGIYVVAHDYYIGKIILQGGAVISPDNTVYLGHYNETRYAVVSIAGPLSGTGTVARLELPSSLNLLGRTVLRRDTGYTGPLQEERFGFTGSWEADSEGRVGAKTASLGFGETRSGWLNGGEIHFYRFTPVYNKSYSLTLTRTGSTEYLGNSDLGGSGSDRPFSVSAVWEDGGTLIYSEMIYWDTSLTTPSFVATDSRDIIVMVSCSNSHYPGTYTVAYNEE
jgi:hypothetical protein